MTTAIRFDPLDAHVQQDPYRYYAQLREEAPAYFIESIGAWGLFRFEDCAHTFKHPEIFSARDFIANAFGEFDPVPEVPSIIALDPPEHTRLRKLAGKAFLPSVIKAMEPRIEEIIRNLLEEHADTEQFDFIADYAAYVPVSVMSSILGVDPVTARSDFKRWTADMLKAPSRTALPEAELEQMHRSVAEARAYFTELIDHKRRNPGGNDLVAALVAAEESKEKLTPEEVLSLIALIQFGGAETPSHLIGTTLWELNQNPDAMAVVKADPSRFPDAVEETLRHLSPVHFVFQTAVREVEVQGVTIPAESMVFSFIGSGNRDPRAFADPDRFDIDRDSGNKHLSFARGAHFCIGAPLGRSMCSKAVRLALEQFPNLHPVEDHVDWLPSFWVRGMARYPVATGA
ncbi:MAG TPA: cytochrome P450 [Solirubrobacteraceae bacterium]|jgi:cytochrome P450|nr:cytochrome P450 [Solirubrobacteraceae bacterium]